MCLQMKIESLIMLNINGTRHNGIQIMVVRKVPSSLMSSSWSCILAKLLIYQDINLHSQYFAAYLNRFNDE